MSGSTNSSPKQQPEDRPQPRILPEPPRVSPLAYVHDFSEFRRGAEDEPDLLPE